MKLSIKRINISEMDYVEPKKIMSPHSGNWSIPKIKVRDYGDEVITEAWWYCPDTGIFITKGVVKREPKENPGKPTL